MKICWLTSSSESLEVPNSAKFSAATNLETAEADDQVAGAVEVAGTAEGSLPTMRASSFAILVGRDWSEWFEELEEKWMIISSDIEKFERYATSHFTTSYLQTLENGSKKKQRRDQQVKLSSEVCKASIRGFSIGRWADVNY